MVKIHVTSQQKKQTTKMLDLTEILKMHGSLDVIWIFDKVVTTFTSESSSKNAMLEIIKTFPDISISRKELFNFSKTYYGSSKRLFEITINTKD